jgi:hypothetical protein
MTVRIAAVALLALPLIAGCATGRDREADAETPRAERGESTRGFLGMQRRDVPNAGPCPPLGVLYDSSRKVSFAKPEERFANVGFTGEITNVRGLCRYAGADPIEMSMEIDFAFGRGPAAEGDSHTYRYWIAVTRKDLAPIEKQYFDVPVRFERGADRAAAVERIERIVIPRASESISGANFEILVGFELTPEELAFNRAGKRFRVDVGG